MIRVLLLLFFLNCFSGYTQLPPNTTDFRGLWVTSFKDNVLGNTTAENELLQYAVDNDLNYLICTNTFQILTAPCGSFTPDMIALQSFIDKAHTVYGIEFISGNVGSSATAMEIEAYNNCSDVLDSEKFDMITYECEFYNPATNGSCSDFTSYYTQLQEIRTICDNTFSSDPTEHLVCEVYIGGSGSTGLVLTNSTQGEIVQIANIADHMLVTYYRSTPYQSSGNFFNWTIVRLEWMHNLDLPNNVVLLFKSRNTDSNNMYNYLLTYPGTHFDAIRAPYFSWVEGIAFDPLLTEGYIESYNDGTYPWLAGIKIEGFTWFENEANQEIELLDIPDNSFENEIVIAPNPAKNTFTITGVEDAVFEMRSADGKLVSVQKENEFDSSLFSNGIYFISIASEGKLTTKKLLIQN
ncbi:T9SS type A sorting domain-containing protein [Ulvibacter antarcticus]|uniref:Putative secreted protein (Por secretion system target) n=1 Tax=Ulvibacter antarcticus TaxID=442714 RepID=A0A3L9YXF8_9FLAO|nr:T9SS type A sorting domain-containing protein [Ulvibacter antarcticus]RMA64510.1 putative secreted protein (Por secretion system target) [Ulvibacter antarcticus]